MSSITNENNATLVPCANWLSVIQPERERTPQFRKESLGVRCVPALSLALSKFDELFKRMIVLVPFRFSSRGVLGRESRKTRKIGYNIDEANE